MTVVEFHSVAVEIHFYLHTYQDSWRIFYTCQDNLVEIQQRQGTVLLNKYWWKLISLQILLLIVVLLVWWPIQRIFSENLSIKFYFENWKYPNFDPLNQVVLKGIKKSFENAHLKAKTYWMQSTTLKECSQSGKDALVNADQLLRKWFQIMGSAFTNVYEADSPLTHCH